MIIFSVDAGIRHALRLEEFLCIYILCPQMPWELFSNIVQVKLFGDKNHHLSKESTQMKESMS